MDKNTVLISVACLFKETRGKNKWMSVQPKEGAEWELPRIAVRKGESSARASIRMCGEQLGIGAQVLEEAGRAGGITTVGKKTLPQRTLYYLLIERDASGEVLAFYDAKWLDYAKTVRNLPTKRDRQMIKAARVEQRKWKKKVEAEEKELARLEKLKEQ